MKNKMSLEWHKNCLKNSMASLLKLQEEAKRLEQTINRYLVEDKFYEAQIKEAERIGKSEFDRDKFFHKRS
jgi:hypothetical protein